MGVRHRHGKPALVLAGVAFVAAAQALGQTPPPTPPGPTATPTEKGFGEVPWSELAYSAHKFLLGADTHIRMDRVPVAAAAEALRQPPTGIPVPLPGSEVVAISVTSDLPFGRDEAVRIFLDPATGAALGGEKTMLGRGAYHKFLRYTDGGLFTWRSSPAGERDTGRQPEDWTRRKAYLVEPATKPPTGTPVGDSYALIYLVSAARLDRRGASLRLVTLADDRFVEMAFATGGLTYTRVSYDESWPGGSRHRQENVLVRTVQASGRALGSPEAGEDVELGFLGMRGALTLFLEVGTGLPVFLTGRAEHVGELTVRLDRAVFKAQPPASPEL